MSTTTTQKSTFAPALALALGAALAVVIMVSAGALLGEGADTKRATVQTPAETPSALRGIHYSPPREAPEIKAVDHNGKPFTLSRQPHPLSMVFFGYVSCTDVCPTNLKKFEKIQKLMGEEAEQVQFVFVSIDPEKETPEHMREYLENYEGEIIGVTADEPGQLDPAYDAWKIVRKKVKLDQPINGRDYKFDHTGQVFLVQNGDKMPVSYPYGTDVETMYEDLTALLEDPSLGERLPEVGAVREVSIPPGSFTRNGTENPSLPAYLRMRAGDTIRWKNDDYMYHFIGDISLEPGGEATQTFPKPGEFYFGCTALPSEVIRINVQP